MDLMNELQAAMDDAAPPHTPRFAPGQKVRVVGNGMNHSYPVGEVVQILRVDASDGTYRARDPRTGRMGDWISDADLEPDTALGWEWLKTVLPAEDVALLEAFDGVHRLSLSPPVRDALLSQVPGLKATILRLSSPAVRAAGAGKRDANSERRRGVA